MDVLTGDPRRAPNRGWWFVCRRGPTGQILVTRGRTRRRRRCSSMNLGFKRTLQRIIRSNQAAAAAMAPAVEGGAAAAPVDSSEPADDSAQVSGESQEAWCQRIGLPPIGYSSAQLARWESGDVESGSDTAERTSCSRTGTPACCCPDCWPGSLAQRLLRDWTALSPEERDHGAALPPKMHVSLGELLDGKLNLSFSLSLSLSLSLSPSLR